MTEAVLLVAGRPWPVEPLGYPGDWDAGREPAILEGLDLLGHLADHRVDLGAGRDDALARALRIAQPPPPDRSGQHLQSPLTVALSLSHTRALDAAIRLCVARLPEAFPRKLLDLLDKILLFDDSRALPYRALLATHLRPLQRRAVQWLTERGVAVRRCGARRPRYGCRPPRAWDHL